MGATPTPDSRSETPDPNTAEGWADEARRRVQITIWENQQRRHLPLPDDLVAIYDDDTGDKLDEAVDAATRDSDERAKVVALRDDEDWLVLNRRFTLGEPGNCGPWNRCLTLLREHAGDRPAACVIERNYVCLDYKSELVAFYAQLDQGRELTTTRLHFFAEPIEQGSVHDLTEDQIGSYLGYLVCREAGLPLVGRAVLRAPSYIDVAVTVAEKVHFFGQDLTVHGMPFMQQDTQLAVCAQVAIWSIQYSAHRLGLLPRRLVAEVVGMSGAVEPMKPRRSDGLRIEEAAALHRNGGLGAEIVYTSHAGTPDLPTIPLALVPGVRPLVEEIAATALGGQIDDDPEDDVARFAADFALLVSDEDFLEPSSQLSARLLDSLLHYVFEPYLRSNLPIYAGTTDHAVVLCGTSQRDGRRTFFVHDDQFGPYLALDALMTGSLGQLMYQAYGSASGPDVLDAEGEGRFPADRTKMEVEDTARASRTGDLDRAVHGFVISGPSRLMLSPADAEAATLKLLPDDTADDEPIDALPDAEVDAVMMRSTVMMGIDYKAQRCRQLKAAGDTQGASFFANLHLAEWVVVVEDGTTRDTSAWEMIFDGTSSGPHPVIQAARTGRNLVGALTGPHGMVIATTVSDHLPLTEPPDRIGKG